MPALRRHRPANSRNRYDLLHQVLHKRLLAGRAPRRSGKIQQSKHGTTFRAHCAGRRNRPRSRDITGMMKTMKSSRCMFLEARRCMVKQLSTRSFLEKETLCIRFRECQGNGPGRYRSRWNDQVAIFIEDKEQTRLRHTHRDVTLCCIAMLP